MRGPDRINALPDAVLQNILSLLPAKEAVRTCVLARSWRHLWRSTPGLRLVGRDGPDYLCGAARDLRNFADNLFRLREEHTDLHNVEIKFSEYWEDDLPYVSMWIGSALMCKVRSLTLHNYVDDDRLNLRGTHVASPHLRTVDLSRVALRATFLDFASCPALEYLKINECDIRVEEISSTSLKHLNITDCLSHSPDRLYVSTPGLVSLKLVHFWGITPFFEDMLLLETACVNLGSDYYEIPDFCWNNDDSHILCGADDNACEACDNFGSNCVLLGGISSARHLELISQIPMIIFARDLEHCPIFSNVKTLLLNEYWCDLPGCTRLAYILKNSPVLEKLTLEFFSKGPNHNVEMKGSYMATEGPSAISEHLKIVEVKCRKVEEGILEVLKFLRAFNIRFPPK